MPNGEPSSTELISALIVDDNAFDRRRLRRLSAETKFDFFLRDADGPETFGAMLDTDKYDVIFLDFDLASTATGLQLASVAQTHRINKEAALIMVAGQGDADRALEALRAGFADYIDKDALSANALERAVLNAVQKKRLAHVADVANQQTMSIEGVLSDFANACEREMQPMLIRMTRLVRQMRNELNNAGLASTNIASIEQSCVRMGEFLQDLGSLASEGRLEEVRAMAAPTNAPQQVPPPVPHAELPEAPPARKRSASLFGQRHR